jgi:hypothetical protein
MRKGGDKMKYEIEIIDLLEEACDEDEGYLLCEEG